MYTPANENDERVSDLRKEAKENPDRLFIVIFDEAHYGVTSEKDDSTSTKKLPYEKLVSILARTVWFVKNVIKAHKWLFSHKIHKKFDLKICAQYLLNINDIHSVFNHRVNNVFYFLSKFSTVC